MPARECYDCKYGGTHQWPTHADYVMCPLCQMQTTYEHDESAMSNEQANALVIVEKQRQERLAEFEAYYARRFAEQNGIDLSRTGPNRRIR